MNSTGANTVVRTSIILDIADNYLEDLKDIRERLENWPFPVEVVVDGDDASLVLQEPADMVVIDYGGMTQGYGTWGMCADAIRSVVKWAEEHPSGLVVIWTAYTAWLYEREISEAFDPGTNKNILFYTHKQPGEGIVDTWRRVENTAARWFGFVQ